MFICFNNCAERMPQVLIIVEKVFFLEANFATFCIRLTGLNKYLNLRTGVKVDSTTVGRIKISLIN